MMIAVLNHVLLAQQGLWLTLGQTPRATRLRNDVWFYLVVLVAASAAIVALGLVIRKYLAGPIESSDGEAMFDLSELRKLHRNGQLTDDEYLAARSAALIDSGSYIHDTGPSPAAALTTPTQPVSSPGVELGPELLGPPQSPTDPPIESDNTDPDPTADDIEPKD